MIEKDSLIEEINQQYNNIEIELLNYKSEINSLQNYITQLEAGLDINSQINNLKNIIYENDKRNSNKGTTTNNKKEGEKFNIFKLKRIFNNKGE